VTRAEREQTLLAALARFGSEWVEADAVNRAAWGVGRDRPSVVGDGRVLSRLAREGKCEVQHDYISRYRPLQPTNEED
jgi:hypothetical protein